MLVAVFFIFLGIILFAIHWHLNNRRVFLLANRFPGPKGIPIFGNALLLIGRTLHDLHIATMNSRKKYGRIYRMWALNFIGFSIIDAKVMEIVMSSSSNFLDKSRLYTVLRPWLAEGLLLSSGKKWQKRRKIITPAFHFSILERFVETFDRQSQILVSILSPLCDGHVIDIHPFMSQLALDVLCENAMGVQINAQTDSESEYVKSVIGITDIMSKRLGNLWMRYDLMFNWLGGKWKRKSDDCLRVLHNFSVSIILKRRDELMKNLNTSDQDSCIGSQMALLDVLLRSTIDGQPLSNDDIREEVDTFMFEGHDTVTIGLSFTLYLISRHKAVQDKLYAEIRDVFGDDKNAPISCRQLHKLKYMESVIKEALRLYPPVPGIGRLADVDVHLDDGLIIPKGATLNFSLYAMFRDPEYFPQPFKFDPDRFIDGAQSDQTSPFTYIPFSAGRRNCIGQKYAMLEMKSVVSRVLRHFELLRMGVEPKIACELVIRTKNGVQLGLKPRTYD